MVLTDAQSHPLMNLEMKENRGFLLIFVAESDDLLETLVKINKYDELPNITGKMNNF